MLEAIKLLCYPLINLIRHGCTHNRRQSIPVNREQTCLDCGAWRPYELPKLTNCWSKEPSPATRNALSTFRR
jgi:hypothetical protein